VNPLRLFCKFLGITTWTTQGVDSHARKSSKAASTKLLAVLRKPNPLTKTT